jgi:hypothetical protein
MAKSTLDTSEHQISSTTSTIAAPVATSQRVASVDILRGIVMG